MTTPADQATGAWILAHDPTRDERLARLWDMTPAQRVAAMHRGELSLEQLAAWTRARPDEVPLLNGEFAWIAAHTPEIAD